MNELHLRFCLCLKNFKLWGKKKERKAWIQFGCTQVSFNFKLSGWGSRRSYFWSRHALLAALVCLVSWRVQGGSAVRLILSDLSWWTENTDRKWKDAPSRWPCARRTLQSGIPNGLTCVMRVRTFCSATRFLCFVRLIIIMCERGYCVACSHSTVWNYSPLPPSATTTGGEESCGATVRGSAGENTEVNCLWYVHNLWD